jgi:hypothetical protein
MSPVLLNFNLQWLGSRIPEGAYYPESMSCSSWKKDFFYYDNSGYLPLVLCLWSQARPWGIHPATINGDVVPNFITIC